MKLTSKEITWLRTSNHIAAQAFRIMHKVKDWDEVGTKIVESCLLDMRRSGANKDDRGQYADRGNTNPREQKAQGRGEASKKSQQVFREEAASY